MAVMKRTKSFIRRHQVAFSLTGLIITLLVIFFWKNIFISIHSGQRGVLYSRFLGGTEMHRIYGEGLHIIFPWNIMYVYSMRIQEVSLDLELLTRDGLTITIEASLRYHLLPNKLSILHVRLGPKYREKALLPILTAALRQTVGNYRPDELYSMKPEEVEDRIMVEAVESLAGTPIIVDNIVVKHIGLPEAINEAIIAKLVAEQRLLSYKYLIKEAQEEAKRISIRGQAVRRYQELVNKNMTPNFLRYEGVKATAKLAESPNSKIIVIGGKDGLPIILNTADTATPKEQTDVEAKPAKGAPESNTGERPDPKPEPTGPSSGNGRSGGDAQGAADPAATEPLTTAGTGPTKAKEESSGLWNLYNYLIRLDKSLLKPPLSEKGRQRNDNRNHPY